MAAIVINASFAMRRVPRRRALLGNRAAVHNLVRTLAAALAPKRIRVDAVSSCCTVTPAFGVEPSAEVRAAVVTTRGVRPHRHV
ncbi:SDR family oxidoreductase [Nocardia sp. NBC_01499]|uniref:SDR family oxidoreductase n=1 Tax=Nocardia sp. NBC_01499 TaxID=2903597 RepID=UPI00386C9EC0